MARRRLDLSRGPGLLAWITLSIICLVVWIIITGDGTLESTSGSIIRWTARTSLVMFAIAYVARPANALWRNALTKHWLAQRKWIGLGFAVSHLAHLGGILALASPDFGAFVRARSPTTAVALLTFVFLFAMAVTSNERIKKKMSPRTWKRLHRTGMHLAWLSFTSTYAAAAFANPVYAIPAVVLFAIAGIRIAAWVRARAVRAAVV
jgi:methionine sulfoxide reductase heme-binding subunit